MKIEFDQDDAKEIKEQIIGAVENALADSYWIEHIMSVIDDAVRKVVDDNAEEIKETVRTHLAKAITMDAFKEYIKNIVDNCGVPQV